MTHLVIDSEIRCTIDGHTITWQDTHLMGLACACVYDVTLGSWDVYGPNDVELLQARLLSAQRVTSFNGWSFDFPIIWELPRHIPVAALAATSDDLLLRIRQRLGLVEGEAFDRKGWGLSELCRRTLGHGKRTHGADAPLWFQAGDWARVVTHCLEDVSATWRLARFIQTYGYVVQPNGRQLDIPPWRAPPIV